MNVARVAKTDTSERGVTRSLPRSLAAVVAELELEQAFLVTSRELSRIRQSEGIKSGTKVIAKRLRDLGWLLPTQSVGVWEFAPGSHAGPIGHAHPFREVKAALAASPRLEASVCLNSALWAHGLLDRSPERPEVAVPVGRGIPAGLARSCRIVHFDNRLPPVVLRGTPVHQLPTVLVHLAARPKDVASWGVVLEALPELVEKVDLASLQEELADRPSAVKTRLAYLVHGVAPDLAKQLVEPGHGKVWFGPRGPLKRHHQGFDVADTVLPVSPGTPRRFGS